MKELNDPLYDLVEQGLSCFRTQCSENAGGNQCHYYDLYYDHLCGHDKCHYNQDDYECHDMTVVITIIIIIC